MLEFCININIKLMETEKTWIANLLATGCSIFFYRLPIKVYYTVILLNVALNTINLIFYLQRHIPTYLPIYIFMRIIDFIHLASYFPILMSFKFPHSNLFYITASHLCMWGINYNSMCKDNIKVGGNNSLCGSLTLKWGTQLFMWG
jgi:hypothetical protein